MKKSIQPAILGKENAANASDVGANKNANDVGVQRIVHISHKLFLILLLDAKLEAKLLELQDAADQVRYFSKVDSDALVCLLLGFAFRFCVLWLWLFFRLFFFDVNRFRLRRRFEVGPY